jgi:lipoprotein-anchoring transpeptidase ErfK/SrfK
MVEAMGILRRTCFAAAAMAVAILGTAPAGAMPYTNSPDSMLGGGETGPIPRQVVDYPNHYAPGTILVSTRERRLYLMLDQGHALRYGIGVGRVGFTWAGTKTVTAKKEWPGWTPPAQMIKRQPYLPRYMPGGPDNPLGARAMYLGSTLYRIHGTSEPDTIGKAVSSGCFRLVNADVIDLYNRVHVGAKVVIKQ